MKNKVLDLFINKKYTPYSIHLELGLPFKEITHYIREDESAKARHKRALRDEHESS